SRLVPMWQAHSNRAAAWANYENGDLQAALRQWRQQTDEPTTLSELMLLAECLASDGDSSALPYIDKLGQTFPWDAEAMRARLSWKQQKPEEAIDKLDKFFHALQQDPWPSNDIIRRSFSLA